MYYKILKMKTYYEKKLFNCLISIQELSFLKNLHSSIEMKHKIYLTYWIKRFICFWNFQGNLFQVFNY
jgi:hypothetical protein